MNASMVSGSILGSPGRTSTIRHMYTSQYEPGPIITPHRVRSIIYIILQTSTMGLGGLVGMQGTMSFVGEDHLNSQSN